MSNLQTRLPTDQWVTASWDEYVQAIENPAYEKAKGYYHNGQLRIEMAPLGHPATTQLLALSSTCTGASKTFPSKD